MVQTAQWCSVDVRSISVTELLWFPPASSSGADITVDKHVLSAF